jgi:pyruvate formate-lyase/glycerol dehydratase family glycyl radical enzyme
MSIATRLLVPALSRLLCLSFNHRKSLNAQLSSDSGWINFTAGLRTESDSLHLALQFQDGKVRVEKRIPRDVDVTLVFKTDDTVNKFLRATPTEQIYMMLQNEMRSLGNASYLNLFIYYISLLLHKQQIRQHQNERHAAEKTLLLDSPHPNQALAQELEARHQQRLIGERADPGVKALPDPYLSSYGLEDFPRLKTFLDRHFETRAEVCPELPKLVTDWHKQHGFEVDELGRPWIPVLRRAYCYRHLMENRQAIIGENDLVAGTTTTKQIGIVVYPEGHGTMIWGELLTVPYRTLNPYDISRETRELLHHAVFPYWARRNFKEWVRQKYGNPLCQQIDERYAVYFVWKSVTISHTIPDFANMLKLGAGGIIQEIQAEIDAAPEDDEKNVTRKAMAICLEGLIAYSKNLARRAAHDATVETNPLRRAELERLAEICERVVEFPARTLDEAVNALWITWVGLHMESTNAGLSLGRLDQVLQPYFEADVAKLESHWERTTYIERAIELVGCLMLRCTDHLPLTPDIANYYFGGSSSDQVITLGGVTPDGEDAVNDMTYIFLKVTEMLSLRDPNVNARYNLEKNSDTYLKRLCEVNLTTVATPSMHNDQAVWTSLSEFNYAVRDLRDWSATGCVEPTLCGKHFGHTNFEMLSLVAALEMALNNGLHPLMNWKLGPESGVVENGDFQSFDQFFEAFCVQLSFLVDQSIQYNEMLAEAHQEIRPTPLLSALIQDCIKAGQDVTRGGARYNSSGAACIGLADVTDSLLVIKKLVFDERRVSFSELKRAVDTNFEHDPGLHALVRNKVPFFGSGSDEAVAMANRVTRFVHDCFAVHPHYRGGKYTAGFWSMSNHVAYGILSGALPSGRLMGKPFTPGLTPQPAASRNLLDNIRDVARLDPRNMNNNMAFNIKVVPAIDETREQTVSHMFSYVKTYFELGGMQIQMNVVTSDTLRDAMAHPEQYRNLLVRISGYNAYFVTLNRDLQLELIERAEYVF